VVGSGVKYLSPGLQSASLRRVRIGVLEWGRVWRTLLFERVVLVRDRVYRLCRGRRRLRFGVGGRDGERCLRTVLLRAAID
jgi:hypothetical protein